LNISNNYNDSNAVNSTVNIINVEPNTQHKINQHITVEIIKCYHSVPTVGYGIIETKKKIKKRILWINW